MKLRRYLNDRLTRTIFCASFALSTACTPAARPALGAIEPTTARDLERLRAATVAYQDIAAAHAVGYPTATPQCLANPAAGGMGHHYVNRTYVDDKLELERPEILLYERDSSGKPKLIAVEYIIPFRILPREAQAPKIFGQDLKQSDELKLWYLHVWAWKDNRAGLFADWNPDVRC